MGKKFSKCETEEFREQSNQGGAGEPVDFVFDVPIHPWRLACNKISHNTDCK